MPTRARAHTSRRRDPSRERGATGALPGAAAGRRSPRLDTVRLILRQQEAGPPPVCPPVTGVRPELARIVSASAPSTRGRTSEITGKPVIRALKKSCDRLVAQGLYVRMEPDRPGVDHPRTRLELGARTLQDEE